VVYVNPDYAVATYCIIWVKKTPPSSYIRKGAFVKTNAKFSFELQPFFFSAHQFFTPLKSLSFLQNLDRRRKK